VTRTNTEGRCRRVARGKTRTRGPLCGGRHAPGAARCPGSIRGRRPPEGEALYGSNGNLGLLYSVRSSLRFLGLLYSPIRKREIRSARHRIRRCDVVGCSTQRAHSSPLSRFYRQDAQVLALDPHLVLQVDDRPVSVTWSEKRPSVSGCCAVEPPTASEKPKLSGLLSIFWRKPDQAVVAKQQKPLRRRQHCVHAAPI
jgi:hypothetical protein